ncbi:prepilin peptidase [Lactobacillus sp. DCY120]|uniref:Prepilin peptidase n=1 Tax=Bombilactobacillus apium TaxID=2675299 RepID=A0A850R632_9LACO|nr:A24 family peptidase [Bombilactobacillus apium]NVY96297.1 prepilin peptidase [Bombilactobacillus apium]
MLYFNLLLSTCLASFAGVVALRLPQGEKFYRGRSHCDHCQHQLFWYQEIPLFSYIFLHGRCAFCQYPIRPGIFYFELFGLGCGILASWQNQYNPYLLIGLLLTVAVAAWDDYLFLAIWPVTLIPITIFLVFWTPWTMERFFSWLLLATILTSFWFFQRHAWGIGDLEVLLVIALFLDLLTSLFLVLGASLLAITYWTIKKVGGHSIHRLPFVPFILVSLLLCIVIPFLKTSIFG